MKINTVGQATWVTGASTVRETLSYARLERVIEGDGDSFYSIQAELRLVRIECGAARHGTALHGTVSGVNEPTECPVISIFQQVGTCRTHSKVRFFHSKLISR